MCDAKCVLILIYVVSSRFQNVLLFVFLTVELSVVRRKTDSLSTPACS